MTVVKSYYCSFMKKKLMCSKFGKSHSNVSLCQVADVNMQSKWEGSVTPSLRQSRKTRPLPPSVINLIK